MELTKDNLGNYYLDSNSLITQNGSTNPVDLVNPKRGFKTLNTGTIFNNNLQNGKLLSLQSLATAIINQYTELAPSPDGLLIVDESTDIAIDSTEVYIFPQALSVYKTLGYKHLTIINENASGDVQVNTIPIDSVVTGGALNNASIAMTTYNPSLAGSALVQVVDTQIGFTAKVDNSAIQQVFLS